MRVFFIISIKEEDEELFLGRDTSLKLQLQIQVKKANLQ